MATTIDELNVKITATQEGFSKEISSVKSQLNSLSSYTSKTSSSLSTKMVAVGATIGGVLTSIFSAAASAISASIDDAIARVDTLNNFANVMGNLGIDTGLASSAVNYLSEQLQGLPTTLDDAATSVQRLVAANNDLGASTEMYLALNNAILAGGTSTSTQASAMEQLLQAYSKGAFEAEEWKSLLVAMPAQLNQIAQAMGYVNASSLYTAMQDGKVSMNDFMATVVQLNNEGINGFASFEEQARSATSGIATSITNLQTAITRAIANIINVIGSSNISGFFSALSSAIGTASNYVAAFVKVVLTAINALRALFGQEQITWGSASDTSSASSGVDSVADSASSASDALDDANDSASALKKSLAGFDEMNVLTQQTSSGSSSSSGSAGTIDTSGITFDVDAFNASSTADAVEEIFQNMMNTLNSIFDFSVIGAAIQQFATDVSGFLEGIGQVAGDIWNNYLLPFLSWAGNSLVPAVLNAIGGALTLLGTVLSASWSTFLKPFIDSFLVPIAEWTGGVIVTVLNNIGDGLRSISQNESAVTALAAGFAALAAAIVTVKIATFLSKLKSGISIFSAMYQSVGSVGTALLAVGTNTTGLTSTFSYLLGNAIVPVESGLTVLKGVISSLWTVISAHPIAAVITVVAALLLTNEELRTSLLNLISAALTPLANMFSTVFDAIEPLLSIVGSLITICSGLLSSILTPVANILATIFDALSPIVEILSPFLTLILAIITPIGQVLAIFQVLAPILEVVAGLLSGLISIFTGAGESADNLGASEEELAEVTETLTEATEGYNEALEDQVSAQRDAADLALSLLDAEDKLAEKQAELAALATEYGVVIDTTSASYAQLSTQLQTVASDEERAALLNEALGTTFEATDPQVRALTEAILEESSAEAALATAQEKVTENQELLSTSSESMTEYINTATEAIKEAGLNADQMNEKLQELSEEGSAGSLALRDAIISDAQAYGLQWDETSQSMVETSESSRSGIDQVFSDIGSWFSDRFNDAKTGIENAFSGVGNWAEERWNDIQDGFEAAGNWFSDTFESAKTGIENAFSNVGSWAEDRFNDIKNGFSAAKDKFSEIGSNIKSGLDEGIGNLGNWLQNKFNGAVDAIKNFLGISSPSKLFKSIGGYMGEGLSLGFDGELDDLVSSAADVSEQIDDALSLSTPSLSGFNTELQAAASDELSATLQSTPIALTVNLGNEKLIDQTINGVNERMFLTNRSVFNL